jgi:hypothetical protein
MGRTGWRVWSQIEKRLHERRTTTTMVRQTPPQTHVHLILHTNEDGKDFYLEIPISVVSSLVVKPLKYLRYLGWCVLGRGGGLKYGDGSDVDLEAAELMEGGTYRYHDSGMLS